MLLGLAPNTLDAYARGLDDFSGFCQEANISPVTATQADLARYVGDLRERQDGRHSPSEVLRGVLGRTYAEEVLSRVLHATQFTRHLDRHGYIRFKHWRLFGENGLPGKTFLCGSTRKRSKSSTGQRHSRCTLSPSRSSLLRDNSCDLSLVRLDGYLYQVMSIEVEVLACLPRYSVSSPHSVPIE